MLQAVVIATYRGSPWLEQCINSIPSIFPVIVVRYQSYECGALRYVMEATSLDRWLFLHDSTKVKDPSWIAENWPLDTSIGLFSEPNEYGSFLGWWKRSVLQRLKIPSTPDKISAVQAETDLPKAYMKLEKVSTLWPDMRMENATPELMFPGTPNKRLSLRYENDYFIKWKSSFCMATVGEAQIRDDRIRELFP